MRAWCLFCIAVSTALAGGCDKPLDKPLEPTNAAPVAAFVVTCHGLTCVFDNASSDADGRIEVWTWDFGDGTGSTEANPTHLYGSPGQFAIRLSVIDDGSATGTAIQQLTVAALGDRAGTYEREPPHADPGRSSRYVIRNDGSFEMELQSLVGDTVVGTTVFSGTWRFATDEIGQPLQQGTVILLRFSDFETLENTDAGCATRPYGSGAPLHLLPEEGIGSFFLDGYLAVAYCGALMQAGVPEGSYPTFEEGVYTTRPGSYLQPPPEAGTVAFVRDGRIHLASADGSGSVAVSEGPQDDEPAWSPDGRRLVYTRGQSVYVMNADGSNVLQRATTGRHPTWSSDGQWVAFTWQGRLWKVSADQDGADPIAFLGDGTDILAFPSWSPLGDRVAFTSDGAMADIWRYDIWTVAPDGSQATMLRRLDSPITDAQYQPAWSPDGRRIALVECPWAWVECSSSVIAVMNADGSGLTRLVATSGFASPTWSPDGQLIAFASPAGIEWVSADGSARGRIVSDGKSPVWRP